MTKKRTDLPVKPAPKTDWKKHGVCYQKPWFMPLFFPEEAGDPGASAEAAKAICATCPVTRSCRDYALAHNIEYGVFGGMTYRERDSYKNHQQYIARRDRERREASSKNLPAQPVGVLG